MAADARLVRKARRRTKELMASLVKASMMERRVERGCEKS